MNSRVDKYYDETQSANTRASRNKELYKEISKTELSGYEVRSNATILGDNQGNINVEKIKSILDTHYNDAPKRKSIRVDIPEEEPPKKIFETKEYDINIIIDKAKEDKIENYSEDRVKKLRDTQYDILNNLEIKKEDYIEDYEDDDNNNKKPEASKELENLINTITLKERDIKQANQDTDPLDIFEDLKGSDNTAILDGLQEKTEKIINEMEKTASVDDSFFTKSNSFKERDFDDFKDIEGKEKSGIAVKIVIIFLILVFIAGLLILVKSFL